MTKFSIVIPCYNESKNLKPLLERFAEVIDRDDIEVVLVDNGSTDDSHDILMRELPRFPFATTVRVEVNKGYGYGILKGLESANGTFIGWTHADLQTDPVDVLRGFDLAEGVQDNKTLFVKGARKGRPLFDNVFTWGMGAFETVYLGVPLWDINAQPTLFHRDFFLSWENPPHDFSLDLFAYFHAKKRGLQVRRLAVRFPERIHGESSWNTGFASKLKFIKRTLKFSVGLKRELNR